MPLSEFLTVHRLCTCFRSLFYCVFLFLCLFLLLFAFRVPFLCLRLNSSPFSSSTLVFIVSYNLFTCFCFCSYSFLPSMVWPAALPWIHNPIPPLHLFSQSPTICSLVVALTHSLPPPFLCLCPNSLSSTTSTFVVAVFPSLLGTAFSCLPRLELLLRRGFFPLAKRLRPSPCPSAPGEHVPGSAGAAGPEEKLTYNLWAAPTNSLAGLCNFIKSRTQFLLLEKVRKCQKWISRFRREVRRR